MLSNSLNDQYLLAQKMLKIFVSLANLGIRFAAGSNDRLFYLKTEPYFCRDKLFLHIMFAIYFFQDVFLFLLIPTIVF